MLNQDNHQMLVDDVAWLQEELELLKGMISIVPYLEKPLEQESVFDMIGKIGIACDSFYKPILKATVEHKGDLHLSISRKVELDNPDKKPDEKDITELLDQIKSSREELLDMMRSLQPAELNRKIYLKGETTTIEEVISDMVMFDRKQLKYIAERTLALDSVRSALNN